MTEWWTILSIAVAVAIGVANTFSPSLNTRCEVIPSD